MRPLEALLRPAKTRTRTRRLGGLLAAALVGACAGPGPPPEPAAAPLDPALALRPDGVDREAPVREEGSTSRLEDRLRQRRAAARTGGDEERVALTRVPAGPGWVSEIPSRDPGWTWGRRDEWTLGTYEASGRIEALVVTHAPSRAELERPAAAANRFHMTVAPELASLWLAAGSELGPLATRAAVDLPMPPDRILEALLMLSSPTLGRGIGFRSDAGSFSGWRWMGANEHGTYLRLGRVRGVWGEQEELPSSVAALLEHVPELEGELDAPTGTSSLHPGWSASRRLPERTAPAFLLLAHAVAGEERLHLALLCRDHPSCPVSVELSRLLATLQPSPQGSRLPAADDFAELVDQAGLRMVHSKPLDKLESRSPFSSPGTEEASDDGP